MSSATEINRIKHGIIPRGLKLKVAAIVYAGMFAVLLIGVSLSYLWFSVLMRDAMGRDRVNLAQVFARHIVDLVDLRLESVEGYASDAEWVEAAKNKNYSYEGMDTSFIGKHLLEMDAPWAGASAQSPLVQEYVGSEVGGELSGVVNSDKNIAEIFITDAHGGLVAASGKTSDFYQADEEWWQKAYNGGKGGTYISDVERDDSSGVMSIAFAVPLRDGDNVTGVCKAVVNFQVFISSLKGVKFGRSGHASLMNARGEVLFHEGVEPFGKRMSGQEMAKIAKAGKDHWSVLSFKGVHDKPVFSAWADVEHPLLKKNGIVWVLNVSQDVREAFSLLYSLILQGVGLLIFLSIFIFPVVYILGIVIVRPIEKLKAAVGRIAAGDLVNKIDIKSGDEIQDLAEAFNSMIGDLEKSMVSRDSLLKEVDSRKHAEDALRESCKELLQQAEVLGKALKEAEINRRIMVSMLEDNNAARLELEEKIKQLSLAQVQLVQSEKMETVGRMAAGIAHEVKNPLGIVLQCAEYLERIIPPDNNEYKQVIQMVKDNVRRADFIVRSLLDFSRVTDMQLMPEDINVVIGDSIKFVQHNIMRKGIRLDLNLAQGLPKALLDRRKIEQVFVNLFNNALDATEKSGEITVRSFCALAPEGSDPSAAAFKAGEKAVGVEVKDTGCGISSGNMNKIFEPFFSTKSPGDGTGLGLSVSRSIIDMHKGLIFIQSREGEGTKVTVYFRLATGGENEKDTRSG